jgi:DNA-binding LacI/PurR family transcriptional regulator
MGTNKKHTLKSIAEELGVSTATISNAFNRPQELSAAKRQQILNACKTMGYTGPNRVAGSLRRGQTNIYALLMSDTLEYMVSDPVASHFMKGVTQVFQNKSKHVLLFSGEEDNFNDIIDFVDGIICYGEPRNPKLHDHLLEINKPIVTVDYNLQGVRSVNIDNEKAAYDLVSQIIDGEEYPVILGLRLLPINVTCRLHDMPELHEEDSVSHRRLIGYFRALQESGIVMDSSNVWTIPKSTQHYAMQAAREVLAMHPLPNLVICMSDLIALTFLKEASNRGIDVPNDLRVVGFDGIEESQRSSPTLSTVTQQSDLKGIHAAEMLLGDLPDSVMLDYAVNIGESTGNVSNASRHAQSKKLAK